jgi:hypothetical protein
MAWAQGALPWLAGSALVLLVVGIVACVWPLRFEVSGRARGEADVRWVLAGGASLGFVSLAFVWTRGIPADVSLLLFGHKLKFRPRLGRRLARPVPERLKVASRRAWGRVDPLGLAVQLLSERRHFRLRYLVLDLGYGFRDPVLTGRLVGALSVLSAVLPARVELRQRPRWDFEDGWDAALDGRALVKPWLVLLDVAVYVIRQMGRHERDQDRRYRGEPAPGRAGHL